MKEATGELNMTIIVSISIGILAAFFFGFLWPMINGNFQKIHNVAKLYVVCSTEVRNNIENETGRKNNCLCRNKSGDENTFYCPFKG